MTYHLSSDEQLKIDCLKDYMPSLLGGHFGKITKTSKFEETYKSRIFKKPVIIKEISKGYAFGFYQLTFREFLRIDKGSIVFDPTPNEFINLLLQDAVSRFNLLKSFVYTDLKTGVVTNDGFDLLKFDLVLKINIYPNHFDIEEVHIRSYYSLVNKRHKSYSVFMLSHQFHNHFDIEIKYDKQGHVLPSTLHRLIVSVESLLGHSLDFSNLNIEDIRMTTEMILI